MTWSDKPCKVWKGAKHSKYKYGRVLVNGKEKQKHRLEWEKHNGPIPTGMKICHHCDNPPCYEIIHLFVGTDDDNMKDKVSKNRQSRGENHGNRYLTEEDVLEIRERYVPRDKINGNMALAKEFNVASVTISYIVNRVTWKHV